jgi:hypothetical protein
MTVGNLAPDRMTGSVWFRTQARKAHQGADTSGESVLPAPVQDARAEALLDEVDMCCEMAEVCDAVFDPVRARLFGRPTATGHDPAVWRLLDVYVPDASNFRFAVVMEGKTAANIAGS